MSRSPGARARAGRTNAYVGSIADEKPAVLYVAVPSALGGSNRALVTLLAALGDRVTRIVAGPPRGALKAAVMRRGIAEDYLDLRGRPMVGKLARIVDAARIAIWVYRRRRNLGVIHANATTGFNLAAPAAILTGIPLVVWVHDSLSTPWGRRLGPILGKLLRRVRWLAVSSTAASVLVDNRLCRANEVAIVPNPIDRAEVVTEAWSPSPDGRIRIGFLGAATHAKGFDLLPDVIARTSDLAVTWKLFVTRRESQEERIVWNRISALEGVVVENPGRTPDVRTAYAQCDMIFNPSRAESFSRVTAEAMLNGLPVVASDIEPMRALIGDEATGLLFSTGSVDAAAAAVRRLVEQTSWGERPDLGRDERTAQLEPEAVAARMLEIYADVHPAGNWQPR